METLYLTPGQQPLLRLCCTHATTRAGLPGIATAPTLVISTITDTESTAVAYRMTESAVLSIAVLGKYQPPPPGKCGFREVDATGHPGLYELHLAPARIRQREATRLYLSIFGALNLWPQQWIVQRLADDGEQTRQQLQVIQSKLEVAPFPVRAVRRP